MTYPTEEARKEAKQKSITDYQKSKKYRDYKSEYNRKRYQEMKKKLNIDYNVVEGKKIKGA